jgi:hypothetical protein
MLEFEPVFEFSRQHCVAICAFLVPANLLTSLQTLICLFLNRPFLQIRFVATLAIVFAASLFLHISTWMAIGVVTPVTFILFSLGMSCLVFNLVAINYAQ